METKIIFTDLFRKFTPSTTIGITLYPFVLIHPDYKDDKILINHELIHIEQQKELWVIPFYILYAYYYLKNLFKYSNHDDAYFNIPFEQEAYKFEGLHNYLDNREKYRWKDYR